MNHSAYSYLLFIYLTLCMPMYIHSMAMPSSSQQALQKIAQLRLRKKHLADDIAQYTRALKDRQKNRENAEEMYPYWHNQHPDDSLQDYIAILDQRVTLMQNLLNQRQQELNTVLDDLNDIDIMFKEKEENGEHKNNNGTRKPSKV